MSKQRGKIIISHLHALSAMLSSITKNVVREINLYLHLRKYSLTMKSICVFCGSSPGKDKSYSVVVERFGNLLAQNNLSLVYGGSNIGLMRILANAVLSGGGTVTGIMPHNLAKMGIVHSSLTESHFVNTMGERKDMMIKLSDAFIALPGGLGTLDELFEILSSNQLDITNKACGILNINNYYDHLLTFLDKAVDEGFIRIEHRKNLVVDDNAENLLRKIKNFKPIKAEKWVDKLKAISELDE